MSKKYLKIFCGIIAVILISILLVFLLAPLLLKFENVYNYNENNMSLKFHVKDEIPNGSYGNEMRIVNLSINDKEINLADYDNDAWVWHEEWGYTLYQGKDEDFVIEINEPIKKISMEYVEQEGSGNAIVSVGGYQIDELNMYRGKWYNQKVYYKFCTEEEIAEKYVVYGISISLLIIIICYIVISVRDREKKHGVSSTLGMFDAAKGISMALIVCGHTVGNLSLEYDMISSNMVLLLFTFIIANGLMPMFYIISGYGFRSEANIKCIKKQISYLIKPYIIVSAAAVICSIVKVFILDDYSTGDLISQILSFLTFNSVPNEMRGIHFVTIGPMWYCVALCIAWIVLNFIFKLKNKKVIFATVVAITIISSFMQYLPYSIYCRLQFLCAIPFIYIGFIIRDKKILQNEDRFSVLKYIGLALISILISAFNGVVDVSSNVLGKSYILGVIGCCIMGFVLLRIYLVINKKFSMKIFKKIGRCTYDIIYIHTFESIIIPWQEIAANIRINAFLKLLLLLSVRIILIYIIYKIIVLIRKELSNIKNKKVKGDSND